MKINVSKKHIKLALGTKGKRSPIEIAIMDMDCFEEVHLRQVNGYQYQVELDGEVILLPKKAQKALTNYYEKGTMEAISFDLPLYEQMHFVEEEMLFEATEDYFGFSMNY